MKKIQTAVLINLLLLVCLSTTSFAAPEQNNVVLQNADSLFKAKQFTQSFDLYQVLFKEKKYSTAMLLKMAYIQEGMGHVSNSLYYLSLYYNITHDPDALYKIEEVATNNKLEGYSSSPTKRFFIFLEDNYTRVASALMAIAVLLVAVTFYLKKKTISVAVPQAILALILIALLVHINFSVAPRAAIISNGSAYLMSGPSAGAHVIAIIGEGNKVEVLGSTDVWLKIKWGGKEVFVKERECLEL